MLMSAILGDVAADVGLEEELVVKMKKEKRCASWVGLLCRVRSWVVRAWGWEWR